MATVRYQQGWKALNRLLHENRSFSGRERHCVFLNTGGSREGQGRFANISAVSGLDFPEDGRAVAACDWDFDGRLDLWFTNRTAPRVRFLRNQNKTGYHFLAIRLQGDGVRTNRDAVGTRVEVSDSRHWASNQQAADQDAVCGRCVSVAVQLVAPLRFGRGDGDSRCLGSLARG